MQDLTGKNTGDELTAAEWNQLPTEVQNAIADAGLTLSSGDLNQLAKAISSYVSGADFYEDSGFSNSHVLSPVGNFQPPQGYYDGMRVRFKSNSTTAGGSTINVNAMGAKNLTLRDGTALVAGIISSGDVIEATYNDASNRFEITNGISASISAPGPVELATQLETDGLAAADKVVTPATLDDPIQKSISDRRRTVADFNITVPSGTTNDTTLSIPLPSAASGMYRLNVLLSMQWSSSPPDTGMSAGVVISTPGVSTTFYRLACHTSLNGKLYVNNASVEKSDEINVLDDTTLGTSQTLEVNGMIQIVTGSATEIVVELVNTEAVSSSTDNLVTFASVELILLENPPVIP